MGYYKNVSYNGNNFNLRSILSIFTIGIFIFLGFASLEESPIYDCEFYPQPITKSFVIAFEIYDKTTGIPIPDQNIESSIDLHNKNVDSNFDCYIKFQSSIPKFLKFGSTGKAVLMLEKMTFASNDDEVNVFIVFNIPGYESDVKLISIKDYNSTNQTFIFRFIKKEAYP